MSSAAETIKAGGGVGGMGTRGKMEDTALAVLLAPGAKTAVPEDPADDVLPPPVVPPT